MSVVLRRPPDPGRWILVGAIAVFAAVAMPVILRGGLLADDYNNCLAPKEQGLGSFLSASMDRLGLIRPARFVEILLTTGVCERLPFGAAIAVGAVLTVVVAFLARGLLLDLGTPSPWAEVAAALWLLHPLGTEAALWPAALHVPMGLALGLAAIRWNHAGRPVLAVVAGIGAALSVEQLLLALPVVAVCTAPAARRRITVATTAGVVVGLALLFLLVPGSDPRLDASASDRLQALVDDVGFLIEFPAVGLGVHSIGLALAWAFPLSLVAVALAVAAGWRLGRAVQRDASAATGRPATGLVVGVIAGVAANIPVVLAVPHQGSPRLFAPTWLILSVSAGWVGARIRWQRPALLGAVVGAFAAGAVLSLALSVSVRLRTADFTESSSRRLAALTADGDVIAVCGVSRTVVNPAPRGAFAVHELAYDWAAADALAYHTGRRARFELAGTLWPNRQCPPAEEVDVVVQFDDLKRSWAGG